MLAVGPQAEAKFGRRYFRDLVIVLTAGPEIDVLHGRTSLGSVDPLVLTRKVIGPRIIVLGGRSWRVTYTACDLSRRSPRSATTRGGGPGPEYGPTCR